MHKSIMLLVLCLGIVVFAGTALIGCGDGLFGCNHDCNDEIDDALETYGPGDCSLIEWSDGDWCYDCWWWDQGISHTFCQFDSCGCDVTTYKFSPIYSLNINNELPEYTVIFTEDDVEIRFSSIRSYYDRDVIPFALSSNIENPVIRVECNNIIYDCLYETTEHDSGITTGILYISCNGIPTKILFNEYEVEYLN